VRLVPSETSSFGELPQHWHMPWEDLSAFAEEDWIPWVIKAGPRKGANVYKNKISGKLADKIPGGGKKAAGGGEKKPPAKKDEDAGIVPGAGKIYQIAQEKLGVKPSVLDRAATTLASMDGVKVGAAHVAEAAQYYQDHVVRGQGTDVYAAGAPAIERAKAALAAFQEQPAGKGKKPTPPGKPAKLTVDDAHAHVQGLIDNPPADLGAAVKDVVERLSTGLKTDELAELAKRLGLTGGGKNKLEKAQKLLDKALAGPKVAKPKPEKKAPGSKQKVEPPKPPPLPEKKLAEPPAAAGPKEAAAAARKALGGLLKRSVDAPGDGGRPADGYIDKSTAESIDSAMDKALHGDPLPLGPFADRVAAYKAQRRFFPDDASHKAADDFVAAQLASYHDDEVLRAAEARELPLARPRTSGGRVVGWTYDAHLDQQAPAYAAFLRGRLGARREGETEPSTGPQPAPAAAATPAADKAALLAAVDRTAGKGGMASLKDLAAHLGWDTPRLHAAAQALRRSGELTGQAIEGRGGVHEDLRRHAIPEPGGPPIGYVGRKEGATPKATVSAAAQPAMHEPIAAEVKRLEEVAGAGGPAWRDIVETGLGKLQLDRLGKADLHKIAKVVGAWTDSRMSKDQLIKEIHNVPRRRGAMREVADA
jgi:hypothetical protein